VYGLVFLVFDVETVLLYPWAVAYKQLTMFGIIEAVIFVGILAYGLFYAWRKGALEWI
jgi:NADH:ubiquinone oxidoreductase subunit 3 (subunit A)